MQSEGDHVLFPAEAEVFINELVPTSIDDIGLDRYDRINQTPPILMSCIVT